MKKIVRAPRGTKLTCKGWMQEAPLRMLMNNLDPEVAECPEELIVYGGTGQAARNWNCYESIIKSLQNLEDDETLLVQSGKPVGVFKTTVDSPRVMISNSMLVPDWATWDEFRRLQHLGLTMYGQMTAGSWIYIGAQGILQGTYETFGALARKHYGEDKDLTGKFILTGGLGGMSGAQPLSVTMNGGVCLCVEVDPKRAEKRLHDKYVQQVVTSLDEALDICSKAVKDKKAVSVGLIGNAADVFPELVKRNIIPDVVTDQTSAHDALNGYVPNGMTLREALVLRKKDPKTYIKKSMDAITEQVKAMLDMQKAGAVAFDYGNNIRGQAKTNGLENAFDFPGFVPAYIRPLFCDGKGPFRWVALSGDPNDIYETDKAILELFPENTHLCNWIKKAQKEVAFQGLPSRICWLGYGERAKAGLRFNELVKEGKISAPIVIGRDHLDCGSVASPYRETESMKDGSDAIADWPILNAMMNVASGATWVSVHHGGGVGIGKSIHAGMVIVCDGTDEQAMKIERVLNNDPGTGIMRHVDAGYRKAVDTAIEKGIKIPMMEESTK